jgi:hypothetical protein
VIKVQKAVKGQYVIKVQQNKRSKRRSEGAELVLHVRTLRIGRNCVHDVRVCPKQHWIVVRVWHAGRDLEHNPWALPRHDVDEHVVQPVAFASNHPCSPHTPIPDDKCDYERVCVRVSACERVCMCARAGARARADPCSGRRSPPKYSVFNGANWLATYGCMAAKDRHASQCCMYGATRAV